MSSNLERSIYMGLERITSTKTLAKEIARNHKLVGENRELKEKIYKLERELKKLNKLFHK